jgi:hypothetical protein
MILPPVSTDVPPVIGIRLPVAAAMWAELIGVLCAWLRLRSSEAWKNRPDGARRLDLLAGFVAKITGLSALLGLAVAVGALVAAGVNG